MPTFNSDPIANALSSTFKVKNGSSTVVRKMETSLKKSLLVQVQFDDPIVHSNSAIKSSYIVLSTASREISNKNGDGKSSSSVNSPTMPTKSGKLKTLDEVPPAKLTLFRKDQVEVGYKVMTGPGSGMWNMGNTCYLNSTLQALFHIPAFVNYLSSGGHSKECSISGFSSCTICIMNSTYRQSHQVNILKPSKVYEKLKFICKHLVHGRQEDAHEFLRYLIESFQRCYLISKKVPKNIDNYSKETTPFNQIFGGYLRQEILCLKCHHVSITFQHFMDIMLDIKNADNIESALQGYFRRETLSQENMYKCEKCKQTVPAHKIYKIERPPMVLCVQLKRFNIMGGKNGRPVRLSQKIELSRFIKWAPSSDLKFTYSLTSLITHVGPSPNCGHYTAIGQAPNGTYYRFDDSSVNPTSVQNVLNTSAYVIFYEMTQESRDRYIAAMSLGGSNSSKSEAYIRPKLPNSNNISCKPAIKQHQPTSPAIIGMSSQSKVISGTGKLVSKFDLAGQNSNSPIIVKNMPKLISDVKPTQAKNEKNVLAKPGYSLVPDYGSDSSSDDENDKSNGSNSNQKVESSVKSINLMNNSPLKKEADKEKPFFSGLQTPFLPRAVAANLKKSLAPDTKIESAPSTSSSKPEAIGIYEEKELSEKEISGQQANISENGSVPDTKSGTERHGFTVLDKEAHNPSIHSDNSSGSTVSFTVSDVRPGSAGTHSSTSSGVNSMSKMNWNVTSVNKRDRPEELREMNDDVCTSPSKKSKIREDPSIPEKVKTSVLEDVKIKTTATLREFSKDFMSAGAKLRQQFEMKSNKVSDKLENISKNFEDILPKFEEPSTSCEASTSQGSLKVREPEEESDKKKKKKKKKKKLDERENSPVRMKEKERHKNGREKSRSRSNERPNRQHSEERERRLSSSIENVRHSSWNQDAPVKKWDNKGDRRLERSVTWDGSKGKNFLDELKRSSEIRSWSGDRRIEANRERKRSISPETDDEMDRGRVKKVKKKKWEDRKFSYNPFQSAQNKDKKEDRYRVSNDNYKRDRSSSSGMRDNFYKKNRDYFKDKYRPNRDHSNHRREQGWDHNYHRN